MNFISFSFLDSDQPPPPPTSATAGAAPDLSLLALRDGPDAFVDEDFCGARALYLDPASPPPGQPPPETVRWLRPAEVCAEAGWPAPALFVDSSSSSDVVQGRLGDCWFLSALAVVALQPRLLARLFRRWDDPPASAGRCTLVFHHDGAWRPVTIDDRLPCDADGQLLYARSATPHEMWVPLVEKAFAKLHGGYEALVSGFADAAMRQLTGGAPQRRLATARTRPSRSGPSCGAGAWADGSGEWTEELLAALQYEFADDGALSAGGGAEGGFEHPAVGVFWIELRDFAAHFNTLYVARLLGGAGWEREAAAGEWRGEGAAGCPGRGGSWRLASFTTQATLGSRPRGVHPSVSGLPLRHEECVSSGAEAALAAGDYALLPFTFAAGCEGGSSLAAWTGGGSKNLLLGGGSREERRDERVARALAASYLRRQHDEMSEAWRRSLAHAAATGSDPRTLCSLDDPLTQLALGRQAAFARGAARADGPRSGGGSPQSPARSPRSGARAERRGLPQRRPVARDKFPG
ncbi:hypothetical protein EMIHUDRAFT_458777 [Emiliania huxleyi CCMP1516]|uniref:Calpain catalytic domain-containing protein n=2 Tax=Emiliania huxleyi TaxID=2903 RepID=A0A0D3J6T8_EMIH1|nr:hypothetical protein EMIHUDRAFT_458777 [Emiliania huxleyi CCMP1516]EOD19223.1 hypothetical protein EMIHUDRAFT_458777 [Emiliania huxleyi CCMP1516]|eukprot:XP_005771652.1 hypothetical protein EMIHUDRAFT_458777 [Emiliania huxleyi CCMP1516]